MMSFSSKNYWEERYQNGGNSGPGSYGRLAEFKANFLNSFVKKKRIKTVLELGSGDGSQLALANYPRYFGFDISRKSVELCIEKFLNDPNKSFFYYEPELFHDNAKLISADLTLSLDVIFHLVEDDVFKQYMYQLFRASGKYVIVYSSNKNEPIPAEHVKHRKFTEFIDREFSEWRLTDTVENAHPYDPADPLNTSFANFYIYKKK